MAPYYHVSLADDRARDFDESLKDLEAKKIKKKIYRDRRLTKIEFHAKTRRNNVTENDRGT